MTRVQMLAVAAGFGGLVWSGANINGSLLEFSGGCVVTMVALCVFNAAEWRRG